jgi:predicted sulfurtransferase
MMPDEPALQPMQTKTQPAILNIAAYLFADLSHLDLAELKAELLPRCVDEWTLKGTILLSPEGINLFLAGEPQGIESFWKTLTSKAEFRELTRKDSYSHYRPFTRMLIKLKAEIIPMRRNEIVPREFTAPRIEPTELKTWLDEKRDFLLLDTRNDFEVELGTFEKAEHLDIAHFCDFPAALDDLSEEDREKPIVTFCTGGIRCEKAGALMIQKGFKNVLQLNGGILRYFEKHGDDHYHGECFVFDQRVAVNGKLEETGTAQCFECRHVLTPTDQSHPAYREGISCPYCQGES